MAGETVLLVEDSSAERDYAQAALEDVGYRVITAANAAAALTFPDAKDAEIIVMDAHLMGVSGFETTRMLRQQSETHAVPILLLIPDEEVDDRQDLSPRGANGFLLKPYDAKSLVKKVGMLIEEEHLDELARNYLDNAADTYMKGLADKHIKNAIERKTQIIIERCIQNVAAAVDQKARAQVNESVAALTAEKEQELVKITVREVAQSMVEKLAERKVTEAMETVLAEQAERSVKKIADAILPGTIRDRLKDTLNNTLPREVQTRVQKAIEKQGPEIGRQLFSTVEETVKKVVPRVIAEQAPEILDRQFRLISSEQVPRLVKDLVIRELDVQMMQRVEPAIRDASKRIRGQVFNFVLLMGFFFFIIFGVLYFVTFHGDKLGFLRKNVPAVTQVIPGRATVPQVPDQPQAAAEASAKPAAGGKAATGGTGAKATIPAASQANPKTRSNDESGKL